MIEVPVGNPFEPVVDNAPTGLTGTIGVKLTDLTGATVTARSTTGITEINPGEYVKVSMTAPLTAGDYIIVWDTGGGTPVYASENLTVTEVPANARVATDTIPITDRRGNVLVGKSIHIYERGTTTHIPIYTDATGTTTAAQPLTTDDDGYVVVPGTGQAGWVDFGLYDVVAAGYWRHLNWDAGSPIFVSPSGAAGGDLGGTYPNPTVNALTGQPWVNAMGPLIGLKNDLSEDITTKLNAFLALVQAGVLYPRGVTILFPPGRYLCNGQITVPIGHYVRFIGSGAGWTDDTTGGAMVYGTEIRRSGAGGTTNTNNMFYGVGTGQTVSTRAAFTIEDMILNGRSTGSGVIGGSLLTAARTQNFWCDNVIFLDHEPSVNLHTVQIGGAFNGSFGSGVQFVGCGADRDPLAVDGGGFSLGGAALGFTAWGGDGTINFDADALHFEGGKGVHLFLGAVGSPLLGPAAVKIGKIHFERSSDSLGTNLHPHLVYGPSQACSIGIMHTPLFRGRPAIWHQAAQAISNTIDTLICSQADQTPVSAPSYYVEVESGQLDIAQFVGSALAAAGGPGIAYCRRKSTAGLGIGHANYDDAKPLLAIA